MLFLQCKVPEFNQCSFNTDCLVNGKQYFTSGDITIVGFVMDTEISLIIVPSEDSK